MSLFFYSCHPISPHTDSHKARQMTGGSQSSPGPNGIEVSIVVSAVSRYSRGSVYLGCYLATLLAHGGECVCGASSRGFRGHKCNSSIRSLLLPTGSVGKVHVVPLPPDGDGVLKKNHHVYIPTLPLQVLRPNGKDLIVGDKVGSSHLTHIGSTLLFASLFIPPIHPLLRNMELNAMDHWTPLKPQNSSSSV